MGERRSWIDPDTNEPLIDDYASQLSTFLDAMADGVIDEQELSDQEKRLVSLLEQVEPMLDDDQHEQVTRLLCELSAYSVMQFCHHVQASRPPAGTTWRP